MLKRRAHILGGSLVTLVRTLMTLRGVNQSELAKYSGVSVTAISRFLSNHSELRSDALLKVLTALGADVSSVIKREINIALGDADEFSIGDDIRFLLEQTPPITRKTITDTLIASFKNDKNPDTKTRVKRLRKYRDSIKTVRRQSC